MMNPKYHQVAGSKEFVLTPRQINPQNVVIRLVKRETHYSKPGTHLHNCRAFYQNIVPNFTVVNIEKPPCFLRKFTPDGRHFIAFSSDQTSVEVYQYMGPSAASDLLQGIPAEREFIGNQGNEASDLRSKIFYKLFRLKHTIPVTPVGEQLNRECSLFVGDGRFVIVGSASYVPEDPPPNFFDIFRNNESVSPHPRSPLEDCSLHIVDIVSGRLYEDTLAVLSVQHQNIHIFRITNEGYFVDVRTIGRFCFDDDEWVVNQVRGLWPSGQTVRPFREATVNGLKHKLLVFLYKNAMKQSEEEGNPIHVRKFYQNFDHFRALRLWKMQLLDEEHLLLKYASEDVVTLRAPEPNTQPAFFVVYNMETAQVINVFENTSLELLNLFENFCDLLRNARPYSEWQFSCSPSSNIYANLLHQRLIFSCFRMTISGSHKWNGRRQAVNTRFVSTLVMQGFYVSGSMLESWADRLLRPTPDVLWRSLFIRLILLP